MNVLLVGSSYSAVPMLFDLKRRGATVTVAGKYEDDPCHSYSDASEYIDYSDSEALLNVCQKHEFTGIVPSCNDYAYMSAAKVAAQLGYPGFDNLETTKILHEKDCFRHFCTSIDLPAPKLFGEVSDTRRVLADKIDCPALVKPVDSFSGRGVERVLDSEALPAAIDRALEQSRGSRAVVEEFVEGSLHSHTAFIADKEIVWHEIVDEFCKVYAYQVDHSAYPSELSDKLRTKIHENISFLVRELGLANGLLHTQFIASQEEVWLIECMRRCPGDLYGNHFLLAEGRDYTHEYVSAFLGEPPKVPEAKKPLRRVERSVVSVKDVQPMFGVTFETDGRPATFIPLKESGHKLAAAPFDKAGILFLEGRSDENSWEPFQASGSGIAKHE